MMMGSFKVFPPFCSKENNFCDFTFSKSPNMLDWLSGKVFAQLNYGEHITCKQNYEAYVLPLSCSRKWSFSSFDQPIFSLLITADID